MGCSTMTALKLFFPLLVVLSYRACGAYRTEENEINEFTNQIANLESVRMKRDAFDDWDARNKSLPNGACGKM